MSVYTAKLYALKTAVDEILEEGSKGEHNIIWLPECTVNFEITKKRKKNKSINLSDTNYSNENNWSCKQQNDNATEFLLPPWSDIVVWKLRQNQEGGEGIIPLPPFSSCN